MATAHRASAQPEFFVDLEKAGGDAHAFADAIVRRGFVRKVFGLLAVQLAVTVAMSATIYNSPSIKLSLLTQPLWLILSLAMSFGPILYMAISEKARHQYPTNLILLGVFTVGEGILVGAATSRYSSDIVLLAMGITAAVTLGLCIYALTTKSDFTSMRDWLWAGLLSLLVAGVVGMVLRTPLLTLALSTGGAVLFSMYIVYDVQTLMGGNHRYKVSPDEYVFAVINIYLDIINLFLHILRILNELKGDR